MSARALTKALHGRWHGSYGTACCPVHDDKRPSLSISERDGRQLVHCHTGCDQGEVWHALQDLGLIEQGAPRAPRAAWASRWKADTDTPNKSALARRIWHEAKPANGTLVETYLVSRGITIEPPPTLRFHPALKHTPSGLHLPAMVAAVTTWPGREVRAVHRTFLTADGTRKAPVAQNRMMLGPCQGGAVRLAPAGEELVLAEGIETALSVLQATGKPVWACLSTSGLKAVVLPPDARTVTVAADGDDPGEQAAQDAGRRFMSEGRTIRIARPARGMDFNDMLIGTG